MSTRPFNRAARIALATGFGMTAFAGFAQPAQAAGCSPNPIINRTANKSIFAEHEYSTVNIQLTAVPCSDVWVRFWTEDHTAFANQDYVKVDKWFKFAKNTPQLTQSVNVHGWQDTDNEGKKMFKIHLSNAISATVGSPTGYLIVDGTEPQ